MTIASILLDLWREGGGGGGGAFEAPPDPGTPKKRRRNRVNSTFFVSCFRVHRMENKVFMKDVF